MKGLVRWGLWVVVPLTLYTGAYYGICVWPRGRPIAQQSGERARVVQAVFGPLMAGHVWWVERHAFGLLEGVWEPLGGGGHARVEFRLSEGAERGMMVRLQSVSSGEARIEPLAWVTGTGRVGTPTFGPPPVEFGLDGAGTLAVFWPRGGVLWPGGVSGEVFVKLGGGGG